MIPLCYHLTKVTVTDDGIILIANWITDANWNPDQDYFYPSDEYGNSLEDDGISVFVNRGGTVYLNYPGAERIPSFTYSEQRYVMLRWAKRTSQSLSTV